MFETQEAYTTGYISKHTVDHTFTGVEPEGEVIICTEVNTGRLVTFRKTRAGVFSSWLCVKIN